MAIIASETYSRIGIMPRGPNLSSFILFVSSAKLRAENLLSKSLRVELLEFRKDEVNDLVCCDVVIFEGLIGL